MYVASVYPLSKFVHPVSQSQKSGPQEISCTGGGCKVIKHGTALYKRKKVKVKVK